MKIMNYDKKRFLGNANWFFCTIIKSDGLTLTSQQSFIFPLTCMMYIKYERLNSHDQSLLF